MTRAVARCGCFLPDLTRLASGSSTTNLPRTISCIGEGNARGKIWQGLAGVILRGANALLGLLDSR